MYLLKVVSGSHHIKRKKYSQGQTFKTHLPLHLTFKNKFECLSEEGDEDELEQPIFLDSNDEEEPEITKPITNTVVNDDDDEGDEDDFVVLPLKLSQISAKRFDVLDATGAKVNDKKLTKKQAEELIAEYEEVD